MALQATTTTTTEVKIAPTLKKKLIAKLRQYKALNEQIKALEHAKKSLTNELGELRDETGEMTLKLEGHGTITLIAGTYKKFNEKKFVTLGGDLAIYEQAIEEKPKRAYNKISLPGAVEDEE